MPTQNLENIHDTAVNEIIASMQVSRDSSKKKKKKKKSKLRRRRSTKDPSTSEESDDNSFDGDSMWDKFDAKVAQQKKDLAEIQDQLDDLRKSSDDNQPQEEEEEEKEKEKEEVVAVVVGDNGGAGVDDREVRDNEDDQYIPASNQEAQTEYGNNNVVEVSIKLFC